MAPEGMRWIRAHKGIQLVELASISAESVLKFGIFFLFWKIFTINNHEKENYSKNGLVLGFEVSSLQQEPRGQHLQAIHDKFTHQSIGKTKPAVNRHFCERILSTGKIYRNWKTLGLVVAIGSQSWIPNCDGTVVERLLLVL